MTAVLNRSVVSPGVVCIACYTMLGSAEESVRGVRDHKEGPLHHFCATPAERRVNSARASRFHLILMNGNGNGASANPNQ